MNLYLVKFWTTPSECVEVKVGAQTPADALAFARAQHPELAQAEATIETLWEGR